MAIINIQNNSVTIGRELEPWFDNEFEGGMQAIEGDKTFIIAELLQPKIIDLMSKSLPELQELHLKMLRDRAG
jgi:hypothetical protein